MGTDLLNICQFGLFSVLGGNQECVNPILPIIKCTLALGIRKQLGVITLLQILDS